MYRIKCLTRAVTVSASFLHSPCARSAVCDLVMLIAGKIAAGFRTNVRCAETAQKEIAAPECRGTSDSGHRWTSAGRMIPPCWPLSVDSSLLCLHIYLLGSAALPHYILAQFSAKSISFFRQRARFCPNSPAFFWCVLYKTEEIFIFDAAGFCFFHKVTNLPCLEKNWL